MKVTDILAFSLNVNKFINSVFFITMAVVFVRFGWVAEVIMTSTFFGIWLKN